MVLTGGSLDVTIPGYVVRHAGRPAGTPALTSGPTGRAESYGQLEDSVRRTAAGLLMTRHAGRAIR
jgi:hypothetical protein